MRSQTEARGVLVWLAPMLLLLASTAVWAQDGSARALTITGQVSLDKAGELWAVDVNNTIQPGQMIVTGPAGYALFQISDGSRFEVFANSRVIFRANRGDWRDLLDIAIGKVKIEIQKLSGGKPNPYRVNSATALVAVRGTVFEVGVELDDSTTVSVEEGQVAVSHRLLPGKGAILLNPGESVTVRAGVPLTQSGTSKARIAVGIIRIAADQAARSIRLGSSGGGRTTTTGTGTGQGQAPPPKSGGNTGDSGGTTTPPPTNGGGAAPPPPGSGPG